MCESSTTVLKKMNATIASEPDVRTTAAAVRRLLQSALSAAANAQEEEQEAASSSVALLSGVLDTLPRDLALLRVQAVLDRTWERLNTGHWKDVPVCQRKLFAIASLHKVWLLVVQRASESEAKGNGDGSGGGNTSAPAEEKDAAALRAALEAADKGLLLGAPLILSGTEGAIKGEDALTAAAAILSGSLQSVTEISSRVSDDGAPLRAADPDCDDDFQLAKTDDCFSASGVPTIPVPSLQMPSLERFSREHFTPQRPVVLLGAVDHWPARRRWGDLEYLRRVAGARTVPIELGAHYVDPDWAQRLMTLDAFVTSHVQQPKSGASLRRPGQKQHRRLLGYLAQHPLFEQVPELRADICVPEYCCLSDNPEGAGDPDINAWFGPEGTVSPLHFDPKHNLLSQVIGSKQIFLYPPEASSCLYPHEGTLLSNTAQIDPEAPDYKKFPALEEVRALKCILRPGDALYIPPRWWHHVRSLSTSFSVSFWWE